MWPHSAFAVFLSLSSLFAFLCCSISQMPNALSWSVTSLCKCPCAANIQARDCQAMLRRKREKGSRSEEGWETQGQVVIQYFSCQGRGSLIGLLRQVPEWVVFCWERRQRSAVETHTHTHTHTHTRLCVFLCFGLRKFVLDFYPLHPKKVLPNTPITSKTLCWAPWRISRWANSSLSIERGNKWFHYLKLVTLLEEEVESTTNYSTCILPLSFQEKQTSYGEGRTNVFSGLRNLR